MMDEFDIDASAGTQWADVVKRGHLGYAEGARILHHLFKHPVDPWKWSSQRPSQWLYQTSQEALEAISNPEAWERGPGGQVGPQKGGYGWDKGHGKGCPANWGHQHWGSSSSSYGQKGLKGTGRGIR